LSGIACCAKCGRGLVGQLSGRTGATIRAYRCLTKNCPLHVKVEPLEQLVNEALENAPRPEECTGNEILKSAKAILAAQREIESYIDNTSIATLGEEAWDKGLRARQDALTKVQAEDASYAEVDDSTYALIDSLTLKRSRDPLPERVSLQLVA
jgi:hypothetical protein